MTKVFLVRNAHAWSSDLTKGWVQHPAPAHDGAGHDNDPQKVGGERDASYQRHEGVRVKHRRAAVAVPVRGGAEQAGQLSAGDQVRHVGSHWATDM